MNVRKSKRKCRKRHKVTCLRMVEQNGVVFYIINELTKAIKYKNVTNNARKGKATQSCTP